MSNLQRVLLLSALCFAGGPAHAGLFSDDEARQQIQQLDTRVAGLEDAGKQQADINKQQADVASQQSRSLLDLQSQLDSQSSDLRTMRGQNEELVHGLQDAEKRQKDFYIDLDTRLRHIEDAQNNAAAVAATADAAAASAVQAGTDMAAVEDPAIENRAYEAAYKLARESKYADAISAFQDFLKKYPESVYIPNVHYDLGGIYLAQSDCKDALPSLQMLPSKYSYSPKTADAMLGVAACQGMLGDKAAAKRTLRQIISKYPGTETAGEAKKRLATVN